MIQCQGLLWTHARVMRFQKDCKKPWNSCKAYVAYVDPCKGVSGFNPAPELALLSACLSVPGCCRALCLGSTSAVQRPSRPTGNAQKPWRGFCHSIWHVARHNDHKPAMHSAAARLQASQCASISGTFRSVQLISCPTPCHTVCKCCKRWW